MSISSIASHPCRSGLPLSWAQQRLWFLDQLDHAAGGAYHMPAALRLQGVLDRTALRSTLDRIVARHENLRTTFVTVDGTAQQVIAPEAVGFALTEHDLRGMATEEQSAAVASLGTEEGLAPFDLAKGPLIRGRLLQLSETEHVLLVTQHHIISDGWSLGVLVREVSSLYAAYSQGQPDPLPALPIQYADYAAWQRQWLQGEVLEQQLSFWREHLTGAPMLLELPSDRVRPKVQSYAGGMVPVRLSAGLVSGLRRLSQQRGTTLFMTLLAGWSVLLSRLSGQSDVVIGTPVANRQRTELEDLIGFFVNTLALRVDVDSDPSVLELLAQVKDTTLGGYMHQDVPFEQVVEALQPTRSLSHSPLFQVMLTLNNTPDGGGLQLPGLRLSPVATAHATTHFDLSLSLMDAGEELVGSLEYASDLFDAATVSRWAAQLERVLEAMVFDPEQRVSMLPLLNAAERTQLLEGFNATAVDYPHDGLIHGLFEAQVARTPDAVAVVYEGEQVSYAELNRRANRVAHRLRTLGVKADDRVAICAERSVEMVVGLLGILKSGGAYVPLDPSYPAERLRYMVEDSAPLALLTQSALVESVCEWLPAPVLPVLALDGVDSFIDEPTHDPDASGLTSSHLAYVIYTSGSTGQPKGVMNQHDGVVNQLLWAQSEFALASTDRVLQKTTFSFDVSVWEFFLPLLAGARLVMARPGGQQDPNYVTEAIRREGITVIHFVPSMLQMFVDTATAASCHSLRYVLCSGEALPSDLQHRFHALLPKVELHNLYGPTEAAVHDTHWHCTPRDEAVPIGRPVANTQIYVLDRHGEPVPLGAAGELHIGGAGVARGYLNRPELTAERFIADPFGSDPQGRLYKTGDLGRYRADGTLEYLGRNDFQVKIRGFRIELGEIESRLRGCAGVREAVVLAREDQPGDKRLVAYVVADDGMELSSASLREQLLRELAEYMVPSAYVVLEQLPLTPNGKLDRAALPAPDASAVVSRVYEAPVGEVEQAIAQVWQELLGLERVGRHDHFFELGGHSLLATQVVVRIRALFEINMSVVELFSSRTIAELARTVCAAQVEMFDVSDIARFSGDLDGLSEDELISLLKAES